MDGMKISDTLASDDGFWEAEDRVVTGHRTAYLHATVPETFAEARFFLPHS